MLFGMDYLGGAQYRQIFLNNHPEGWAAGFFVERSIFGNPRRAIRRLAKSGKCPVIKLNLNWNDNHIFTFRDFKKSQRIAKRYSRLIVQFPDIKWYVSGATEHRLNRKDSKKLARMILEVIPNSPNVFYVNNPWIDGGGALIRGQRIINEVHGKERAPRKGPFTYSFDGKSCVDLDVETIKKDMKNCEVFFFWHPAYNGRKNTTDPTPRPERRAWPTPELIKSIEYLANDAGDNLSVPSGWIWKTHADRHDNPPEPRAYKPVLITTVGPQKFELVTLDGRTVHTSTNRLDFEHGKFRYYFLEYGYKLAEKAIRMQGHPICKLKGGNKEYGRINPAFREGIFR